MKRTLILAASMGAAVLFAGCQTIPPGAERGPDGTIAYDVLVEASEPGARIEANGENAGNAPVHLKIFGDVDGTFHDFGSDYYVIHAFPITTNQYAQTRLFGTGRFFGPEDRIPQRIFFDMNTPAPPPSGPPSVYGYPGPPYYYYYPAPYFRFYWHPHYGHPRPYRRW